MSPGEGEIALLVRSGHLDRIECGGSSKIQPSRDAATGKVTRQSPRVRSRRMAPISRSPRTAGYWRLGDPGGFVCLCDPATGAAPQAVAGAHDPKRRNLERVVRSRRHLAGVGGRPNGRDLGHGHRETRSADSRGIPVEHVGPVCSGRADHTVIVDGPDRLRLGHPAKARPGRARTPEQLWDDLNGEPEVAFRAVWLAAADPKAVEVFGKKVPASAKPDPERFKKLVEELASAEFQTREAAEKGLAKFGPAALALARKARAGSDSDEVRTRLDRIIKVWSQGAFAPENWRRRRAIVAMELANTAESRALLKRWAADAPGTVLSDDAAAALERLERLNKPNSR